MDCHRLTNAPRLPSDHVVQPNALPVLLRQAVYRPIDLLVARVDGEGNLRRLHLPAARLVPMLDAPAMPDLPPFAVPLSPSFEVGVDILMLWRDHICRNGWWCAVEPYFRLHFVVSVAGATEYRYFFTTPSRTTFFP